jgi:hypothetical protein
MNNDILTEAELEGQGLDSLENIFVEQESAFDDEPAKESETEKENSVESSTEKNESEKEPSQEGEPEKDNTPMEENLPFHKHPRFKEIIEENNKLKDEIAKVREDVSHQFEEIKKSPIDEIPESFKKLYGDSPEVWNTWKEYLTFEKANIEKGILEKIKAETESKLKQEQILKEKEKQAQEYFENQFKEIETTDGKIDRNAIVKILEKYHPIEPETGFYDIKAAYDIYKQLNRPDAEKSAKRKMIADTTNSTGNSSTDSKPVAWDSIRNKGFGEF